MVADFAQTSHSFNTVAEFFVVHERNLKMLYDYVEQHNDYFVKELLVSIPHVTPLEVHEFMEYDRGMKIGNSGSIFNIIKLFFNNGKEDAEFLKAKFELIANRNKTIIMILNNSGF